MLPILKVLPLPPANIDPSFLQLLRARDTVLLLVAMLAHALTSRLARKLLIRRSRYFQPSLPRSFLPSFAPSKVRLLF